ncbi:2TM domain-containing protein [Chryseobacterium sp. A321]
MSKNLRNILLITLILSSLLFGFLTPDRTVANLGLTLGVCLMYTVILGVSNTALNTFLNQKFSWAKNTGKRVALGILLTLVVNAVLVLLCNYLNFIVIQGEDPSHFFNGDMNFRHWFILNIALLVTAVMHINGFVKALKRNTRSEVVEQKIIASAANAQFESLKNQLDPHFLFNSLNVLSALIEENSEAAQKFTDSMSKVYRYVLEQKDKELVSTQEEIEFAKTYCELLKTRFEESVQFEFDVNEKTLEAFVVPLSLQLLLENSIKHNFATESRPLRIRIYSEEGFLCVENNYQPREQSKERHGIGLSNIVQRYALLTSRNVYIEKSEEKFKVKIPLLTKKITAMQTYEYTEDTSYKQAKKRVEELKGFYGNLISYCIFIPFLFFINWKTSPNYWWAFWPMLGWGIGVVSHAVHIFGIGRDWEERQIKKYMKKENANTNQWK